MKDEIKEILEYLKSDNYFTESPEYEVSPYDLHKSLNSVRTGKLLDYITNLQEEIKRQEDNYKVMQEDIAEVGKLLGLRDDFIISEEMPEKIKELQQKVSQYENPDDLTLFYMWLDEKAKDKMKHLENEVANLKQQNAMITKLGEDYKSRCEKASELIHDIYFRIDFNNLCNATWVGIKLDETSQGNDLLNILQGSDKE